MFKVTWEKTSITPDLQAGLMEKMLQQAYPNQSLLSYEWMAGGCANLNLKVQLKRETQPLLLRIYVRDPDAAYREQKLSQRVKATVPVPLTYYISEQEGYRYAITEWLPGLTLRELLLGRVPHDIGAVMTEVSRVLANIAAYRFPQAGFLDNELKVIPYQSADILTFAHACLTEPTVLSVLSPHIIAAITQVLEQLGDLLPDEHEKQLVHGDFDPANLLVDHINGVWKVTGVLDWEFAFSGSILWDVATMLRYAHKMPSAFQTSFIQGLAAQGIVLPETWQSTVHLLNLSALLDCLKRSDVKLHPHRCQDIRELIGHILHALNSYPSGY